MGQFKLQTMKVKRLNKLAIFLYASVVAILLNSCATTTYLNTGREVFTEINSFGDYDVKNKTFYIESCDESVSSSDLEFKEYAGYYAENLKIKGAIETSDKDNADICVLMNYCITDKSYQETIPVPEFGRTSIASTTTKGSTTTYNYNYGTTGYYYVQNDVSSFLKIVNIYAFDNKSRDKEPIMLWKTNFKSEDYSNDLRGIIPYMIFPELINVAPFFSNMGMYYVEENNYLFQCWKDKKLSNSAIYMTCKSNADLGRIESPDHHIFAFYVEKQANETIICLMKYGQITYNISPELYIVCNGDETKIDNAENYTLGSIIYDESGFRYFIIHFPVGLGDAESFEIREYTNSKHTKYNSWGTVYFTK